MQPHVEIMGSGGRNHAIDVGKNKRGQQNDDATANASDPAPRCRSCPLWNLIGHKQSVVLMSLGMRIADAACFHHADLAHFGVKFRGECYDYRSVYARSVQQEVSQQEVSAQ